MQKTLAVVDLAAVRHNACAVRKIIGDRFFFAVVKADAYGHGAAEIAREIEDIADGFCVAICDEGAALRIGGIQKPILVLTPPLDRSDAARAAFYNLQVCVVGEKSARLAHDFNLRCHIAINTGMNRYGCFGDELKRTLSLLKSSNITGVYSHLYAAENDAVCARQLALFKAGEAIVKRAAPHAFAHIAASGGVLRGGKYLMQGVRCGLLIYGYAPDGFEAGFAVPALKVYARLAQSVKPTGGGVGYNIADKRYDALYTYRLGYADGFRRAVPLGEKNLCMDSFISERGEKLLPVFENAREYAARCGTISYEALCLVTKRSERIYERRFKEQIRD